MLPSESSDSAQEDVPYTAEPSNKTSPKASHISNASPGADNKSCGNSNNIY